jgi:protoheme IX farnesyltransferase
MTTWQAEIKKQTKWRDYLELCKPRVVALMVVTAIVGMCLATPNAVPLSILFWGNLGIAFAAGAAAAINHIADRYIDCKMHRTKHRPLVQGHVSVAQGLFFAATLGGLGAAILFLFVNALTAWLTLASLVVYAGIYSFYLKHATDQNIVIGGIAGAAPPLLGWVAVTDSCTGGAFVLMLIIYAWTPPHFWALAVHRVEEYRKANVPMLPVIKGVPYTIQMMILYLWLLFAVSLLPFAIHLSGWFYLVSTVVLNFIFLGYIYAMKRGTRKDWPMRTFRYSILYLLLLFVVLLIDHYWGGVT